MQPGQEPQWRPLKRHESHLAEQMVERAAELARDSHARTRHAAVLVRDGSLVAWGTNGVPFPCEAHRYCKLSEVGHHSLWRPYCLFALSSGLVGYSAADYDTIAQLRW